MTWSSNTFASMLLLTLRMTLCLIALIGASAQWGHYYVEALLPLYRSVLQIILGNFHLLDFTLQQQHNEFVLAAHFETINAIQIDGNVLPANTGIDASTLAAHAFKHVIIVVTAIGVWPQLSLQQRARRLLISIPLLIILEIFDIPFALAGAVQDVIFFNLSSNYATNKPLLVHWLHFLDGGGRAALSILTAITVNAIPQRGEIFTVRKTSIPPAIAR